jgi:hypothetical protein
MDGGGARADAQTRLGYFRGPMKACVARAVYAEIAMAAGTWSNGVLARRLAPHTETDIDNVKERLRQLRAGSKAPTWESWAWVAQAYPQVRLQQWSEHPLFLLLNPPKKHTPVGYLGSDVGDWTRLFRALDVIEGDVRYYLWQPATRRKPGTGPMLMEFTEKQYNALVESSEFEALDWALKLTIMVALAKLGQWCDKPLLWKKATIWTYENFSRVVAVTPQLLVGWIWLERILEEQLWSAFRPHAALLDFFTATSKKSGVESAVGIAAWHRHRFGIFDPLSDGEKRSPPLPYVSATFLRNHCELTLERMFYSLD